MTPGMPSAPKQVFTAFDDVKASREKIYDSVLTAARGIKPLSNGINTLSLHDIDYIDPPEDPPQKVIDAKMKRRTLERRIGGVWRLTDDTTGKVVAERPQTIGAVPKLTDFGTFLHRGNAYVLRNQQRMRAGMFVRRKKNEELEVYNNFLPGQGKTHRYSFDPEKSLFYTQFKQSSIPLYTMLRAMGAPDDAIKEAWGEEIYKANRARHRYDDDIRRLAKQVLPYKEQTGGVGELERKLKDHLNSFKLDPETTARTLRAPHETLSPDAILSATKRLLSVARGEDDSDDRDAMTFQSVYFPDRLFAERLSKDYAGKQREILWKATNRRNLDFLPTAALRDQIYSALLESGLGQAIEEVSPMETLDRRFSVTRLGEGAIPSIDVVPDEARQVQSSHLGYLDSVRTPESLRVGVDLYFSSQARRGPDDRLYTPFIDAKNGRQVMKTPEEIADSVVGFPNSLRHKDWPRLPVLRKGKESWAKPQEIDYFIPSMEYSFSPLGNMIPLKSATKGQRVAMGSRMITQALPLRDAQAPLVRTAVPFTNEEKDYDTEYGKHAGAIFSEEDGVVVDVGPDRIKVRTANGVKNIPLYKRFPLARKTSLLQMPVVKPGQPVKAGQPLAKSNFTDDTGAIALGRNVRTAYMPYGGNDFEDAIVVSESLAQKMASVQTYQKELETGKNIKRGLGAYVGLFPTKYNKDQLSKLGKDGVIRIGETVKMGDPLLVATRDQETSHAKVHKRKQGVAGDASVAWEHEEDGQVVDVVEGKYGPMVLVETVTPLNVADKLAIRFGGKGVISKVVPDADMPRDQDGNIFEAIVSDDSTISRTNPSQLLESLLGRIAEKIGKPIRVEDFRNDRENLADWAEQLAKAHGVPLKLDVYDPTTNRKIKINGGPLYTMKLSHLAEDKLQARGGGGYSSEGSPAGGPGNKSKRVALMDTNTLLARGGVEALRDAHVVRGQRNEQYWMQYMQGYDPPAPKEPLVYKKAIAQLKASGINVVRSGTKQQLMAMTNKAVDQMTEGRLLDNSEGVDWNKGMRPIPGGLFDPKLTGGHNGELWSAIELNEPMPNPAFEEPIRRMLGLTKPKFEAIMSGKEDLPGFGSGPQAMLNRLKKIDVPQEIENVKREFERAPVSRKDALSKKRKLLEGAKVSGIHPSEWFVTKVPVLPPLFRPVALMSNNVPLVSDANYLYKELIDANKGLSQMKEAIGENNIGNERLALYGAYKAVVGLGDPLNEKLRNKQVKGVLRQFLGGSPKTGMVQRKLLSTRVDNIGRAVITPNPNLDMDTIGIPEEAAFEIYSPHIARRLRRIGMPLTQALQEIKERSPRAKQALLGEMEARYVYASRAPVLHKHGHMSFKPVLVKGNSLQLSPMVHAGFGADYDGDQMNFAVPATEEARVEARDKLLPSKILLSAKDYKTPVHMPSQQYVGGIYAATRPAKADKQVRIFASKRDAMEALDEGTLDIDDPIIIRG